MNAAAEQPTMKLIEFSTRRRVTVAMLMVAIIMLVQVFMQEGFVDVAVVVLFIHKQNCADDHQRQRDQEHGPPGFF